MGNGLAGVRLRGKDRSPTRGFLLFLIFILSLGGIQGARASVGTFDLDAARASVPKSPRTPPGGGSCGTRVMGFLNKPLIPTQIPANFVREVGRTVFYPMVLAARGVNIAGRLIRREPTGGITGGRTLRKEMFNLAGFLALFMATQASSITYDRFDRVANNSASADSLVIVVNGFPKEDPLYKYVNHRFSAMYGDHPNAHKVIGKDWTTVLESISGIARAQGRKIDYIEIHGHGLPGQFTVNGDTVNPQFIDVQMGIAKEHNIPVTRDLATGRAKLCGVFAAGAEVKMFNCSAAQGRAGDKMMQALGNFLLDEGGEVDGVTVELVTNIPEHMFIAKNLPVPDGAGKFNRAAETAMSFVYMVKQGLDHVMDPENPWYFTTDTVKHLVIHPTEGSIAGL
jgi:hypothetical protein